ncbi:Phage capsid family./Caudovirus prohead protease [Anaerostipes hadrus]|uniref:Phage capsid family./Caudovirus prohead protease n=1 Tax=Anaerostipes hadrus TaxID=649756 RepID=D4N0R6_ANAHA|nr:phage major capsid protein [Anaerostipes hadrus]CBL38461.1 Phage capsid family./Caudovirus prohead protease [Anaerostipes hadrus]
MKYDFSGWATRANLKCSDGRTIMRDAFKQNDGQKVPLVWNHQHDDPNEVLGHALLENREDGVYAYCSLNDTEAGKTAKLLIQHGDISALSIYANQLKQNMSNVVHGNIREVSLVLAGANPGASIQSVIQHGATIEDEAMIYTGEELSIMHSDDPKPPVEKPEKPEKNTDENGETIGDIFNTLDEKQKEVVYALIGEALENNNSEGGDNTMKHNVFDQSEEQNSENVLSHSEMQTIIEDGKRFGSLKESFLQHAEEYGIENIEYLFPEAKSLNTPPDFIKREMGWVQTVMSGVHHTPFSRIKSMFADITADEARARGYMKGKLKKEEVFGLLKRTTTPTTIYKKQKLDRDDVIDITDFDVVAWLKSEMRMMLEEEMARAILIGDGRLPSSDDKINEQNIRPIWKDEELYTIRGIVKGDDSDKAALATEFIDQSVRSMTDYRGSGSPTAYMTAEMLTECLLLKDTNGKRIYSNENEVATAMRVSKIVTVPVMNNQRRKEGSDTYTLQAIIVNLNDYNVGADKGGAINMFDDFDIDYNQQKYLIETRCSGALTKPFSAIVLETKKTA